MLGVAARVEDLAIPAGNRLESHIAATSNPLTTCRISVQTEA
jgi:hypothetical protein